MKSLFKVYKTSVDNNKKTGSTLCKCSIHAKDGRDFWKSRTFILSSHKVVPADNVMTADKIVPAGNVVPSANVVFTLENTDPVADSAMISWCQRRRTIWNHQLKSEQVHLEKWLKKKRLLKVKVDWQSEKEVMRDAWV